MVLAGITTTITIISALTKSPWLNVEGQRK
jgi:hypothetical protein